MLIDLVVDTNVFVHSHNQNVGMRYAEALDMTRKLIADGVATVLRVDPGFSLEQGRNTSRMGTEYLTKLVPGMLAYQVIQALAANMRLRPVEMGVTEETRRAIEGLVCDPSDRVFLQVTLRSEEGLLVTHDDVAFPDAVRDECEARWPIKVGEAIDAAGRL